MPSNRFLFTGSGALVIFLVLCLISSAQVVQDPRVSPPAPDLPSFTGFVRFNDGNQLFLNVRRTAYNRVELQTPGSNDWKTVGFEQFPHGERQRLKRLLMVREEQSPPRLTGVRVTLKGGETIEGFMKEDHPEDWPEETGESSPVDSDQTDESSITSSGERQTDTDFVLLTRSGQQRRLTYNLVKEKELIEVNPLKMAGAEQLYEIERAKRDLNSARPHWELGKLALNLHQFERARNHFQEVARLKPSYQPAVKLRLSILDELRSRFGPGSDSTKSSTSSGADGEPSPSSSSGSSQGNPFSNTGN